MENPKYKIGEMVIVRSDKDKQKFLQGAIKSAEFLNEWFYQIEASNPMGPLDEPEQIYSYEKDTGDAKTKIIKLPYIEKSIK